MIFPTFGIAHNIQCLQIVTNCFLPYSAHKHTRQILHMTLFDIHSLFLYSPHLINDKATEKWRIDGWVELIWIKYTQAFRPAYNKAFLALINRWKHLSIFIMMKICLSLGLDYFAPFHHAVASKTDTSKSLCYQI